MIDVDKLGFKIPFQFHRTKKRKKALNEKGTSESQPNTPRSIFTNGKVDLMSSRSVGVGYILKDHNRCGGESDGLMEMIPSPRKRKREKVVYRGARDERGRGRRQEEGEGMGGGLRL